MNQRMSFKSTRSMALLALSKDSKVRRSLGCRFPKSMVTLVNGFFKSEKYMVVISSVQLRGHLMGNPVYMIDGVSCLSFDSYKACQKLDTKVGAVVVASRNSRY